MATDFNKNAILASGGFISNSVNTPLDIRTRVATEADIMDIPNPYIGMVVFVEDTGKRFEVVSLKAKQQGITTVENALVNEYKELQVSFNDLLDKPEIPSIEGLATEAYVQNKIAEAQLDGGEVDLSGLATKDELALKADKAEIPSVEGLASEAFVNEAIAAIELKEGPQGEQGPAGADGKDFTYDMFTEEQLEALRGPQGEQGPAGQDGKTPVKGVDYFTEEDIAALNIPSIEGLATEQFVQAEIAKAQMGGENGEVDLSAYATIEQMNQAIEAIELKEGPQGEQGPAGQDGKDFTYDMFTEEQLAALKGEKGDQGEQGPAGADGKDGVDGKDFTYDMFTEEQLEALKGEKGDQGDQGLQGEKGDQGEQGEEGPQGVGVVSMEIDDNNHLMVTLTDDSIIDAGQVPVGEGSGEGGGGGADSEEVAALKDELQNTKQQLLDLTYGVEYEWISIIEQANAGFYVPVTRETCPQFWADVDAAYETGDDSIIEEFIVNMYAQDIYRMYVLRGVGEPAYANRYEFFPLDGHEIQPANDYLVNWTPVTSLHVWNWDGNWGEGEDESFTLDAIPTSKMIFAFMKVKEEYRGNFGRYEK